jgi:hypothetical protein
VVSSVGAWLGLRLPIVSVGAWCGPGRLSQLPTPNPPSRAPGPRLPALAGDHLAVLAAEAAVPADHRDVLEVSRGDPAGPEVGSRRGWVVAVGGPAGRNTSPEPALESTPGGSAGLGVGS